MLKQTISIVMAITAATVSAIALLALALIYFETFSAKLVDEFQNLTIWSIEVVGGIGPLIVAFILGAGAYGVRRIRLLPLYAIIELLFGIYGAAVTLLLLYKPEMLPPGLRALAPSTTAYTQYVGLGSSVFVIVRGLDNWFTWFEL